METSAFDVLGSVLLGYLESVGEEVATNVEESGRSSAHVNAYDVLNAVEGCTAVAATQLRLSSGGGAQQQQQPLPGSAVLPTQQQLQQPLPLPQLDQGQMIEATSGRGWEGLASFLFGSNWYSIPLEGEDTPKEDKDDKSSSTPTTPTIMNGTTMNGSGKGGPSTNTGKILPTDKTTITTPTTAMTKPVGGSKSGKGKQLANMTPPPGVSVVGNEVIMGNNTTGSGTNEKNVSFSLLERKNSKGDSSSILLHGTEGGIVDTKNNNHGPSSSSTSGRWDAPYLNEVAPFPLVTRTEDIANPHCLSGTTIALSMHDLATEQEACRDTWISASSSTSSNKKQRRGSSVGSSTASSGTGAAGSSSIKDWRKDIADLKLKIPKDVFATKDIIWGSMKQDDDSNKKKKKDDNGNTHNTSLVGTGTGGPLPKLPAVKMPSYVPNFFPPFPRTEESISSLLPSVPTTAVMSDVMSRVSQKRKSPFPSSSSVSGSNNNETVVATERNTVRHSLVELGKNAVGPSYWGSNWLNNNDDDDDDDVTRKSKEKLKINNTAGQLTVTPGPSSSASSGRPSDNNTNNKKAGGGGADAQVVPLARASGSRVAKILEGSN